MRFVGRNALLCALIGAALLRYFYVFEQWRARVRAEAKARFDALQARIRPHFLFNSMNTIASLIPPRPHEAERAIEDLADLFRAALGNDARKARSAKNSNWCAAIWISKSCASAIACTSSGTSMRCR